MHLKTVLVLAVALLGGVTSLRIHAQDLAGGKERIRSMITKELEGPTRLPSMAVAVVQRDAIVWEEAFGWADQQRRIEATPATPYYVASVTKVFTGTALALLADDGRVDMNRPVNAYLGSHKVRPALDASGEVTGALAGANTEVRLMGGAASGPRVFGRLPEADLGIEEARPGSYDVQLGLEMRGSRLVGFATTAARPGSPGPALTFLAELTRR